jgi:uncharacterized protein
VKIVFDDPKRALTLARRGLDFTDLTIEFFAGATIIQAKDSRFKAVGEFGSTIITVIFKPLGSEALSVISMRRANRSERKGHAKVNS